MNKIAVLGAGLIGGTIVADLKKNGHEITCIDINLQRLDELKLKYNIQTRQINLLDYDYTSGLAEFDLVVSAVPGFMGYNVLEKIINAKKNCVDISFFPEEYSSLRELAIKNDVTIIIDCGVAPGMSNLILGRENAEFDIHEFKFYVGGLPQERVLPFEYKAPFSPADVIEEYIRPVRMRFDGEDVITEPLTELEEVEIPEIGLLEGFNTDGLRSLLTSFPNIPNMSEKTLRYPGYAEKIQMLKDMGFFNDEHIEDTAKVLKKAWNMTAEDKDFTAMIVELTDIDGEGVRYKMLDYHDGQFTSMSRTTAYTCTAMVELVLGGKIDAIGVLPPEAIGSEEEHFDFIIDYLKMRNVIWVKENI